MRSSQASTTSFNPAKDPNFWGNNAAIIDWEHAKDEASALKEQLDAADMTCACVEPTSAQTTSTRPHRLSRWP